VRRCNVITAEEMHQAVLAEYASATIILMAAAVADYRPAHVAKQKLKKTSGPMSLELERTTDILAELAPRKGARIVVGFAAETEQVTANAERKRAEKDLDLIVANDVAGADTGFEVDTNAVVIIDRNGHHEAVPLSSKGEVADAVLDRVVTCKQHAAKPLSVGKGGRGSTKS
jgi:phosphopantothenoylcysteine decarboxylase/phosphopantothenate--cysteine ligase